MMLKIGDRVYHARGYKHGTVVYMDDRHIKIEFDNGQERKFSIDSLGEVIFPVDSQGNPLGEIAAARIKQEENWLARVEEEQAYTEDYVGSMRKQLRELDARLWEDKVQAYEQGWDARTLRADFHHLLLRSIIDEPFRVHLYLNEQGIENAVHIGKHDIDKDGKRVVFSWNSKYGEIEMISRLETAGVTKGGLRFTINKRRDILFGGNAMVHDVREMEFSDLFARTIQGRFSKMVNQGEGGKGDKTGEKEGVEPRSYQQIDESLIRELRIDDLRASRLRQSSRNLNHIFWTISYTQSEIVRSSLDKAIVIQGGAGSGKSSVGMHRLAYLIYNNQIGTAEALGPSKAFAKYAESLLEDLGMDSKGKITCRTKSEFFSSMCEVARKLCERHVANLLSFIEGIEGIPGQEAGPDMAVACEYQLAATHQEIAVALKEDVDRLRLLSLDCLRALNMSPSAEAKGISGMSENISSVITELKRLGQKRSSLVAARESVACDLEELQRRRGLLPFLRWIERGRIARLTNELLSIDEQIRSIDTTIGDLPGGLYQNRAASASTSASASAATNAQVNEALSAALSAIREDILRIAGMLLYVLQKFESSTMGYIDFLNIYMTIDDEFRHDPNARMVISDYYFIDEGQDWTLDEYQLLRRLIGNRVVIAGDVNQRIWAGGGIDDWKEVGTLFDAAFYELKYNWRSTVSIVSAAQPYKVNSKYDNIGIVEGDPPQYSRVDSRNKNAVNQLLRQLLTQIQLDLPEGKTAALILGDNAEFEEYVTRLKKLDRRGGGQRSDDEDAAAKEIDVIKIRRDEAKDKDESLNIIVYRGAERIPQGVIVTSIDYVKGFEFYSVLAIRAKRPTDMTPDESYRMYTIITRATDKLYLIDLTTN